MSESNLQTITNQLLIYCEKITYVFLTLRNFSVKQFLSVDQKMDLKCHTEGTFQKELS